MCTQKGQKKMKRTRQTKVCVVADEKEPSEEGKVFPATNSRPGTHQRKKGEILSITFRKTPESKEGKGEGGEGG